MLASWLFNCATKPDFDATNCETIMWPTRWNTNLDPKNETLPRFTEFWKLFCVHYTGTPMPKEELYGSGYRLKFQVSPIEEFLVDRNKDSVLSGVQKKTAIEFIYQFMLFMSWIGSRDTSGGSAQDPRSDGVGW